MIFTRNINKLVSKNLNFRSISSKSHVDTEQLYTCFQKDPIENLSSLKFVPKKPSPKIAARIYHDASEQAKISKRIIGLQNLKLGNSNLLTSQLKSLLQFGQPSLMNFSTQKIVKSRTGKSISKHKLGLSGSSSKSSFVQKPNTLLQKFMVSYNEFQPKRYRSTETFKFLPRNLHSSKANVQKKNNIASSRTLSKARREGSTRLKDTKEAITKKAETPSELLLNIKDRLENLSMSIKNDLIKVDGSLKEKINVMKSKFNIAVGATDLQKDDSFKVHNSEHSGKRIYKTNLQLMPMKAKTSKVALMNNHTKSLDFDPQKSVVVKLRTPSTKTRLGRDLTSVDSPDNGRAYIHQFLEPFKISGQLMEKPDKRLSSMNNPILGITLKSTADADGIYRAPKKIGKSA